MSHTAHVLPPLYAGWMDALLAAPVPAESNATCGDCAMVFADRPEGGADAYRRDTKCCTYLPELWSFLVGGVLLDVPAPGSPAERGRRSVEARLDAGVAVTPLGLGKAPLHAALYERGREHVFGKALALRCPHYLDQDGGLCGVWAHRESTCATWFCKHVRGATGKEFWKHLHQLLVAVEKALAAWCALELGLEPDALAQLYQPYAARVARPLTGRDVDGLPDAAAARRAWGRWLGREREFYVACARRVQALAWEDVLRIGGAQVAVYAHLARHAHARLLDDAVPERLVPDLVQISPRGRDRRLLVGYSGLDGIEVPAVVPELLAHFDGRATAVVLEEIARERRVRVDPSLVRKLADFGVLVAAPAGTCPRARPASRPSPARCRDRRRPRTSR
jgi:hypothetical protein